MIIDIEKMLKDRAENAAWSARSETEMNLVIGRIAPIFLRAINRALAVANMEAEFTDAGLHTYWGDGAYATYELTADEAMADIRRIAHAMVQDGWKFDIEEDLDNRRIVFKFRKNEVNGMLFVRPGASRHCRLVEAGEEYVPATTRKKYKMECDPRPQDTPLELQEGDVGALGGPNVPF